MRILRADRELAAFRPGGREFPFDALVAGVAANTVHRFFARRFPERNRLRKRLRYIIETGGRFRLWTNGEGMAICALAGGNANAKDPLADAADVERSLNDLRGRPLPAHPLANLVFEVLRALARPIDLTRLTGMAADLTGLQEATFIAETGNSETGAVSWEIAVDPASSAAVRLNCASVLASLWREVLQLSFRHRSALLLSARAPGGAALGLVVDLGTASFREVASALEMSIGGPPKYGTGSRSKTEMPNVWASTASR